MGKPKTQQVLFQFVHRVPGEITGPVVRRQLLYRFRETGALAPLMIDRISS